MRTRTLERTASLTLVAGLTCLAATVLLVWLPSRANATFNLPAAQSTLAKARVLRAETAAADDRFDTLVEGLVADLGFGTPPEMAPDLDHIQIARSLERALGRRTPETERSITQALARANETLTILASGRSPFGAASTTSTLATLASLAAAVLLVTAGAVLALRSLAARRAELVAIAERLSIPPRHAVEGTLAEEVTIYVFTRQRTTIETVAALAAPSEIAHPTIHAPHVEPTPPSSNVPPLHVPRRVQDRPGPRPTPPEESEEAQLPPLIFNIEPLNKRSDD